jgi:myo-inositol-hexaphosphate 3-phosphohydrolase
MGCLVVHDGQDEPGYLNIDGDEIENAATNFTCVSWSQVADALGLDIDTGRPVRG